MDICFLWMHWDDGPRGIPWNNTCLTRMGEFGDTLWESCIYPKFGHLENTLIGGMAKLLVD